MLRALPALIIVFFANIACADKMPDGQDWFDGKAEGWFWYKSTPEPEEPKKEEKPVITPVPPPAPLAKQEPAPPAVLSSAWLRANMQKYLDAAMDDPTPENVTAYLYLQKHAMDKSFAFMDSSQEATLGNSELDEISRRPTATFANTELDKTASLNGEKLLAALSDHLGFFLFIDGSAVSQAQIPIFDSIKKNYGYDAIKIAVGYVPDAKSAPEIRTDNGHAQQMGVTSFPAIVMFRSDGVFDVVSQAPVSYSDLQKRILLGAKRLGVISEDELNSTRPIANIKRSLVSIPTDAATESSSTPIPPSEIVKAFRQGH